MDLYLYTAMGASIALPAVTGCIWIRKMDAAFYPFVACIWIGTINETVSFSLTFQQKTNIAIFNAYLLAESLLILYQFFCWSGGRRRALYLVLIGTFFFFWAAENVLSGRFFTHFSSYYLVFYSLTLAILGVSHLNARILVISRLAKDSIFLITSCLVVYFTYSALIEVFWLYGFDQDPVFSRRVYDIHAIINLVCNLIFTYAILCIPKKATFLLQ